MSKFLIFISIVIVISIIAVVFLPKINKDKRNDRIGEEGAVAYAQYLGDHNFLASANKNMELAEKEELRLCEQFIQENPNNIYAIYRRASLNSLLKNWEASIADYLFLLNKYPTNTQYIAGYVDCYIAQHKTEQAKEILETYYQNIEKDARYFGCLGRIYLTADNLDLAIENYKKAVELDPNSSFIAELNAVFKVAKLHQKEK